VSGDTEVDAGVGNPNGNDGGDGSDASGTAAFLDALRVQRNAAVGFAVGTAFALLVFARFVLLAERQYPLFYWLALAFVLAMGVGLLTALVLTVVRAYRLTREL